MPVVGLEPTRGISPTDFESVTSTIPSHRLLKIAADESAATLELDARFELATSWLRIRRSTGWANPAFPQKAQLYYHKRGFSSTVFFFLRVPGVFGHRNRPRGYIIEHVKDSWRKVIDSFNRVFDRPLIQFRPNCRILKRNPPCKRDSRLQICVNFWFP